MAGRIKQEDIEAVRERTDIVKLVSQYLTLKKAGGDNMTGLCPFHQEKTPSFSISPAKQVFYCHGCGKGGDAIGFLRELEHLGFAEAVERLAQQAGVHLRYEGDSPAERRARRPADGADQGERGGRAAVRADAGGRTRGRGGPRVRRGARHLARVRRAVRHRLRARVSRLPARADDPRARTSPRSCSRRGWPPAATTARSGTGSGGG